MKHRRRNWSSWVLVALFCGILVPLLLHAGQAGTSADSSPAVNLVVSLDGQVTVKRKDRINYTSVVFGTRVEPGDLIRIGNSSHAKVVCSDLTLHDLSAGVVGTPCLVAQPLLRRADGTLINATRSWPSDGSIPIVLSPRKTKLLSPRPLLRWTPVEGADEYSVVIRGTDFNWACLVRSLTEIAYPEGAPRLEPGVDYKLVVQTRDRSSADEPGMGLGFEVLVSRDRKTVEQEQRKIEALHLPDGPTQFLIAYLYAARGLNAEAIQRLENVSQTFKAAAVMRLLGSLYSDVGLVRQAEAQFLSSIKLSKDEKDEDGQMLTHLGLANIYEGIGNTALASQHFEDAVALAEKMGDDHAAAQGRKRLAALRRTGM